jgi:hypothetical protein
MASGADAKGFPTDTGFMVLKGSRLSAQTVASFERHGGKYIQLRRELETDGSVRRKVFTRDIEFNSPSAASSVVCGRMSNGLTDWVDDSGKTLRESLYG